MVLDKNQWIAKLHIPLCKLIKQQVEGGELKDLIFDHFNTKIKK